MKTINEAMRIIRGSKQYKFNGTVLTITGYYSGESIKLDLSRLTPEMLDELQVKDGKDDDNE